MPAGARRLVWMAVLVLAMSQALGLARAEATSAMVPPAPPRQGLAVVEQGVVWFDDGATFLAQSPTVRRSLGRIGAEVKAPIRTASSATAAVALVGGEDEAEFVGVVPPHRLVRLPQPKLIGGGGCKGWQPGADFVLAGDDLVTGAECHWENHAVRQPLFVKSLTAGRWYVLRWLPGDSEPILAAERNLLAVGVQRTPAKMDVRVLNLDNGHTRAHFELPNGYLAFASSHRLVLSQPAPPSPQDFRQLGEQGPFDLALYSTGGQLIAQLGHSRQLPLVSGMHFVNVEERDGQPTVTLHSLVDAHQATPLVGFDSPRRALVALAFRWPRLALLQTTSQPLPASQITCFSGRYGPASAPSLRSLDLAHSETFDAPPAPADPSIGGPLINCPPPPP